ncbi:uncharacterized protein LOC125035421 isoform X2 [Penaeus chinensis]|uniref:uncharacterized protein LOC125035421 isoform X2 n=1 Tax=Penaeus chinensis TaxID=139456 RepID=UPI001FB63AF2|nr:uncharacterized protein LOC125035421 isoform X2 [Penaeus chinensis]
MLKWLVTRGPTTSPVREVVTDDPLATLKVKTKGNSHEIYAVSRVNPLYHDEESESTVTVHAEDEEEEDEEDDDAGKNEDGSNQAKVLPESPPTDRGSVRSSGYGSKETDSVSERSDGQEDDLLGGETNAEPLPALQGKSKHCFSSGASHLELRKEKEQSEVHRQAQPLQSVSVVHKSFEDLSTQYSYFPKVMTLGKKSVATIINQHSQFVHNIEVGLRRVKSLEIMHRQQKTHLNSSTVPRPIWPRVSGLVEDLQKEASKSDAPGQKQNALDIIKQDLRYVTSINVLPRRLRSRTKSVNQILGKGGIYNEFPEHIPFRDIEDSDISRYFRNDNQSSGYQLMSLHPDSLVSEDTLRMMRYSQHEDLFPEEDDLESAIQFTSRESPLVMPDFSQAMYTRGLYATLNRAASLNTKDIVKPPYKNKSRSFDITHRSFKSSAKKKGLANVKDLWEKSGLKTNGRKLLVDVSEAISSKGEDHDESQKQAFSGSNMQQLKSLESILMVTESRSAKLDSNDTVLTMQSSHTYEDLTSFDSKYPSHPNTESMESKSSGTYAEIGDIIIEGIDNPAFLGDDEHAEYTSAQPSALVDNGQKATNKKVLDPDRLAQFKKKINEKLQGAPLHRMQWLDLDEIVIDDIGDRQERRVKFTADTFNPNSMRREVGGSHQDRPFPGAVLRQYPTDKDNALEDSSPQKVSQDSGEVGRRGIWTTSESYRERFQEAPKGTVGRERRQQLWESYYGMGGHMDRTLPRHLAPHPNSKAPFCGPGNCHDFTLDLYRAAKLRKRSEARRRRRRCYAAVLIVAALVAFLGAVVTISWYYTGGQKFFGSM